MSSLLKIYETPVIRQALVIIISLVWMAVPLYCELPWWYNLLFLQHLIRLNGYWNSFNEIWDKRKELNGGAKINFEEQEEIRKLAHLTPVCQSGNSIADIVMLIGFAGNLYYLYLKFFG